MGRPLVRLLALSLMCLAAHVPAGTMAGVACTLGAAGDAYCARQAPGSVCANEKPAVAGSGSSATYSCTNPYDRGCLPASTLASADLAVVDSSATRVCSTLDGEDLAKCVVNKLEFPEVRLFPGNWESSMFTTWIAQIYLAEIMKVPATIEVGSATKRLDFYDPDNSFDYPSLAYDWDALKTASTASAGKSASECPVLSVGDTYKSCAHAHLEVWPAGNVVAMTDLVSSGSGEDGGSTGTYGNIAWYTFESLVAKDPSLKSFYAYNDKVKMAKHFKRPVTWYEYCVEPGYGAPCDANNQVAQAPPVGDGSVTPATTARSVGDVFFDAVKYKGHFVADNCTSDPDTCGGYLIQAPCQWSTFSDAQMRWSHPDNEKLALKLNGSLITGGYGYGHMRQILKAAGTNSEQVLMWWWSPEADLTKWKLDPKWKMTAVELPDYTEECNEKRPAMEEKCSATETTRWGAVATSSNTTGRVGAGCSNPTELLKKVFSIGLRRQTTASTLGVPSPGHAFLQRFQVDQADVEEMLYRWRYGHPQLEAGSNALWARRVVCEAARNISTRMRNNFPEGYPKVLEDKTAKPSDFVVLQVISGVLLAGCIVLLFVVHIKRNDVKIRRSQPLFLKFILLGAAILYLYCILRLELASSDYFCHLNVWAFHIGWAVFFLPLLLKTYRLLQVFTAAKHMKRKTVSTTLLLGVLTAWIVCVEVLISALWSGLLNPRGDSTYMTDASNPSLLREYKVCQSTHDGVIASAATGAGSGNTDSASTYQQATAVYRSASVSPNSAYAPLVAISSGANGLLVFAGVVLAIRTRNISSKFSESSQQAAMMYNSGVFTALVAIFFLTPAASPHASARAQVGCMMLCLTLNLLILFVPKLFDLSDAEMSNMSNSIAKKSSSRKKSRSFEDSQPNPDQKRRKKNKKGSQSSYQGSDSVLSVSSEEQKAIELTSPGTPSNPALTRGDVSSTVAYTSAGTTRAPAESDLALNSEGGEVVSM